MAKRKPKASPGSAHATLITNMRELRGQRGLTQAKLAAELNVEPGTVSGWETGAKKPDFDMLDEIALFYSVSVDSLFRDQTTADAGALLPPANTPESFFNCLNALVCSEMVTEFNWLYNTGFTDYSETMMIKVREGALVHNGKETTLVGGLDVLSRLLPPYKNGSLSAEMFGTTAKGYYELLKKERGSVE